jgi:putative endopeptidase
MAGMKSGIAIHDLDPAVRPQDDLFRHANGGWLDRTPIPGDRGRYGSFDILRERAETDCHAIVERLAAQAAAGGPGADASGDARKVADLYRSFMDEDAVEAAGLSGLTDDLAAIEALASVDDLAPLLGRWAREGVTGLVAPFVWTDARDSTRYALLLEQAGIGLPDESYYREEQFAAIREAYVAHVGRMLSLAGAADAEAAAGRVMELETAVASHHWDRVQTRDAVKTYTKWTVAELESRAPAFDWRAWLAALGVADLDDVIAREPSFLESLGGLLAGQPLEAWQDWLRWTLVHAHAPYLSAAFVDENFDFYGRTLSGLPQQRERWKRGISLVESALGEALGREYVAEHFPPAAKERMTELVANLVEAFRRDFADLPWMGEATREQALAKLETFRPKIGHPETWRDYSALEVEAGDLLGNVRRANAFETDRQLAKLGGPVDRDEWFMTPQTINAYYNPGLNEIVFPAAILQPPFFDVDADDAANYGGIGAVIGHEVGHGFDDQGSRFDADGNLRDWWTEEDRARFEERSNALIAQFDTVEPADAPGHTINGALTVGENIGDLGGLTIGLKAYRIACEANPSPVLDGLTGDQRFFLGWAQVWKGKARTEEAIRLLTVDSHSPSDARARVARNLEEFHEAFGVQEGDGMWLAPGERVRIF